MDSDCSDSEEEPDSFLCGFTEPSSLFLSRCFYKEAIKALIASEL